MKALELNINPDSLDDHRFADCQSAKLLYVPGTDEIWAHGSYGQHGEDVVVLIEVDAEADDLAEYEGETVWSNPHTRGLNDMYPAFRY